MAAPAPIITLNLGSQSLELTEFRIQPRGGLVLCGYRSREFPIGQSSEAIQLPEITSLLREMLHELRIRSGQVSYAIAEQAVFTRFVKLPSIEQEKIEKIISFEAQQNVPFPIDQVVWDYQLINSAANDEIQVVLVAVKADLLEEINRAVEASGLRTSIVDLATMALYNAFRYNYGDPTGCSLLVDIGARTTNLLFIEPRRIFSRSVPIGGSSVTSAIAKEFNEPFAAAELRKKRDGFVRPGGDCPEAMDSDTARLSKIALGTMTRLHAELMRSISHYRIQQHGNPPERVFLSGGTASTRYLLEFFREKLQLPTEFFDPLRNVAVADSLPADEIAGMAHLLGEPVGLALRMATACPMALNLRPPSVVRAEKLARRRPLFVMAATCFLLALLGWGVYYLRAAQVIRQSTSQLQQKINIMRMAEARLEKLRKKAKSLDAVAAPLIATINDRGLWPEILEELNARLPKEDIWITELIPTSGGKPIGANEQRATELTPKSVPAVEQVSKKSRGARPTSCAIDGVLVRGLYLFNPRQQDVVVDYFRNLVASAFFKLDPSNQAYHIKPSTPNNSEWAFSYELRLDLSNPIELP
jgi:type IV pilus assembly protein PilM